jgi:hypothetical protein
MTTDVRVAEIFGADDSHVISDRGTGYRRRERPDEMLGRSAAARDCVTTPTASAHRCACSWRGEPVACSTCPRAGGLPRDPAQFARRIERRLAASRKARVVAMSLHNGCDARPATPPAAGNAAGNSVTRPERPRNPPLIHGRGPERGQKTCTISCLGGAGGGSPCGSEPAGKSPQPAASSCTWPIISTGACVRRPTVHRRGVWLPDQRIQR